jgi:molybdenum cofactor cytidylyltransferase
VTTDPNHRTIAAVLLGAGESTRMREGDPELPSKALLPWKGGEPLIAYQVHALHEAGYDPIVVVLGHEAEAVAAALPEDVEVNALYNPRYEQGRTWSIMAGLLPIASYETDAVLIISVDQPRSAAMLRALRERWMDGEPFIVVPSLNGKAGHPPLFDGTLIPELLQTNEQTQGLRQVMLNFADKRVFLDVDDPLTLTNLNTHEDYEAALRLA